MKLYSAGQWVLRISYRNTFDFYQAQDDAWEDEVFTRHYKTYKSWVDDSLLFAVADEPADLLHHFYGMEGNSLYMRALAKIQQHLPETVIRD